jgi:6-phosphogluconolactonase
MSFLRAAARAALAGRRGSHPMLVATAVVLAGFLISCGGSSSRSTAPNHTAYVTLPARGSVAQLHIDGATGAISVGAETPQVQGTSPQGLALIPSKKFLYAINSRANSISTFNVNSDGSLSLGRVPTPAGNGADNAVIDPSGKYLLVTNNFSNSVSVFAIDAASGDLSEVPSSPFYANSNPTEILITPSGQFVYVTNPGIGMVTGFSFSNGVLTPVPNSPVFSGLGASALAIDSSGRFLYVANASAINTVVASVGNISGYNIDQNTGALAPILGSPFTSTQGNGPTALAVDPSGRFVYAISPGSSYSIWCFTITATNGQLTAVTSSPFSVTAGGLFALFDLSGNYLYVGSSTSNGVAVFTYNTSTGAPTAVVNSPFSTATPPGKMVLSE